MSFIIYGTPSCSFCNNAKALLKAYGEKFTYIDISENKELKEWVKTKYGGYVPQIFLDDENLTHIGGFTQLNEYLAENGNF